MGTPYAAMLDGLVVTMSEAFPGVPVTRDPGMVPALVSSDAGGCIFVGFPVAVARLLDGPNLDVPVSLVAPAPSDLRAIDWLLDRMDDLVEACRASSTTTLPIEVGDLTYPAVTVTARIAL
jgi:hypothetical protein